MVCQQGFAIAGLGEDGSVICRNLNVGALTSWSLDGNAATTAGTDFLGTTDNEPLEIHVNIGGGLGNTIDAGSATIDGGSNNSATGNGATIGGGSSNQAIGDDSTVPGGQLNTASGRRSVAMGHQATAALENTFVFNAGGGVFSTTDSGQFLVDVSDGVGIGENNPTDLLHVHAPPGRNAMRVQIDGTTRLRVHDNGGVSIGLANATRMIATFSLSLGGRGRVAGARADRVGQPGDPLVHHSGERLCADGKHLSVPQRQRGDFRDGRAGNQWRRVRRAPYAATRCRSYRATRRCGGRCRGGGICACES